MPACLVPLPIESANDDLGSLRALSFDLDGTLLDTAGEIALAAARVLRSHGMEEPAARTVVPLIGHGNRVLMEKLFARAVSTDPTIEERVSRDTLMADFDAEFARANGVSARAYAGVREGLEQLATHGVMLACVSSKTSVQARQALVRSGLAEYFRLVIGRDTLGQPKPHRALLERVMDVFDVAPHELAHVGDSLVDLHTARNAGVAAWAVPYGYTGGVPIESLGPDRVWRGVLDIAQAVCVARPAIRSAPARVDRALLRAA